MAGGALHRLTVWTPRGTVEVEVTQGGWRWHTPSHGPIVVRAQPRSARRLGDKAGKKAEAAGLPIVDVKLTGADLETEAGAVTAKLKASGLVVLGAQQLVVAWDGKVARPVQLRSPVWGAGGVADVSAPIGRAPYEVMTRDANPAAILQRLKVAPGRWLLQLGEAEVGGDGHVVWIQRSLVAL